MNRPFWRRLGFLFALSSGLGAQAQDADQFEFRLHGARLGDVTFFNTTPAGPASAPSNSSRQLEPDQTDALWASGKTRGMAHWFKNYAATFRSNPQPNGHQAYRVIALDADVPETRHIEFPKTAGSTPRVIDFSDRTQAEPLPVDPVLDQDRIDPLSVLQKLLRQVNQTQSCDAVYRVYDGKRRYTVLTETIATDQPLSEDPIEELKAVKQAPPTVQCQITLQTKTNHKAGRSELDQAGLPADTWSANRHQSVGFWPFKKQEQTMTIEFKPYPAGYRFSAFDINSPFGTIKGRPGP